MTNPQASAHSRAREKMSATHTGHAAKGRSGGTNTDVAPEPLTSVLIDGVQVELGELPDLVDLDMPRDGIPAVVDTEPALRRCAAALAAGHGPAAVDTERASGFRYGQRAMLVQIRRDGAGTWLIDPEAFPDLKIIDQALDGVEWILHAASQDLPCLAGV